MSLLQSRRLRPLESLLRHRRYPGLLQWPLLAAVALFAFLGVREVRHAEINPGAGIVWQLWWPVLPFLILLTARLWCAICPLPKAGEALQSLRGDTAPSPPPWLRRLGPWLATAALAALGFVFLAFALETNGFLTAVVLAVFAAAAIVVALLWRDRPFCRYLCPLGLMAGLYSRLSFLRLGAAADADRKDAAAGAARCQFFTSPVGARRAHDCVLCADCMKAPKGEAVAVRLEVPSLFRTPLSMAEAVAITVLLGMLLADALRMTPLYTRYMSWAVPFLGNYRLVLVLGIAGVVGAVLLVQFALVSLWRRRVFHSEGFKALSLAWLPVTLATHLALSAQHLLAAKAVIKNIGAELTLLAPGHMPPTDAYSFLWSMKLLQFALLLGAAAVAFLLMRRFTHQQSKLYSAMAVLPAVALLAVFSEPMSAAC